MLTQGLHLKFLTVATDHSHLKRVLNCYVKRHRDELLGHGYHQFIRSGRGVLVLSCGYRELFFGKGFYPERDYLTKTALDQRNWADVAAQLPHYDPETEILVCLNIQHFDVRLTTKVSKRGLALSVLHRQYLEHLLDFVAIPGMMPS